MSKPYQLQAKSHKLNIGIICFPTVGGSGIVATDLGHELAMLGHKVHFISYDEPFRADLGKKNIFFHKVNINEYTLFKYPDYTLPLAVKIGQIHQKYKLDILHVHYAVPHATAALLAKRMLIKKGVSAPKIVTTLHGTDISIMAKDAALFDIIKYSVEYSDAVTAVSNYLKTETIKTFVTQKNIEVVHNCYRPRKITNSSKAVRNKLRILQSDFLAIHMSNLRHFKRIPDLLKIAYYMKTEKKFRLLILAGGDFSQYLPLVKKYKLNNLIVKEKVHDIHNYINAADLGIYTSNSETFGMSILETMSYGKTVISTNVGGVPEVIENKTAGILLPVGKTRAFVSEIKNLIKNPQQLKNMGEQSKNRASLLFSPDTIVKKYLDIYRKLASG